MPIKGSCLCGGVRFEVDHATGPFELCHCNRCRKATGSAFAAMIGVRRTDFRFVHGADKVAIYDAPIVDRPPAYRHAFCRECGSTVPDPNPPADFLEIPAGLLDDDPQSRPDRHICVDLEPAWFEVDATLPRVTKQQLAERRRRKQHEPG